MKKTRRFVALLLAAVLALALFTACGAAEQPQSAIGKVYEDWFVEQINSKRPGNRYKKLTSNTRRWGLLWRKSARTGSSKPETAGIMRRTGADLGRAGIG